MTGAVAAGHPASVRAGRSILEQGGNAVDAALGAVFAAFAAEGPLTGPAGGGFVLIRQPGCDPVFLDCFFTVPSTPRGEMDELVIDFADSSAQVFHVGPESVAVPGLVHGLEEAHARFGRLRWGALFEPALELAAHGVEVGEAQSFLLSLLLPLLTRDPTGAHVYGTPGRLRTDVLLPALELIRDEGSRSLPRLVPELASDLASYRPVEREAIRFGFRGLEVWTAPAPSIGGGVVRTMLEELESARDESALVDAVTRGYAGHHGTPRVTGTTHVSVIDQAGLAVGISSTLGSGSGVFRSGFELNNMLGELDVIGAVPREPGSRLPSMMAPTLALSNGVPRLVVGSAGSVRLAGAIAQVAWRVLALGMTVAEAIDAPRVHADPGVTHLEGGWRGREPAGEVVRWAARNLFFGGVSAVAALPDGTLEAAGDPRRGGAGVVV
ncbi:MAG: gamma-glutamyltransferase [Gaiella sp.]